MPKPYILNGIKNWVITPAIGGYSVNKLTKVATDALTEGRGLDFDLLAGEATGTNEFVGGMFNPGYSVNLWSPNFKKLYRSDHLADKYILLFDRFSYRKPRLSQIKDEPVYTNNDIIDPFKVREQTKSAISRLNDEYFPVDITNGEQLYVIRGKAPIRYKTKSIVSPFDESVDVKFTVPEYSSRVLRKPRSFAPVDGHLIDSHMNIENIDGMPIFDTSWKPITDDYKKFADAIDAAVGDDGLLSGSVRQFADGWFPCSYTGYRFNPAHDLEFVTTLARLESLAKKLQIENLQKGTNGIILTGQSRRFPELSGGATDILPILELDGKAFGELAHEIYAYLHPEEYAKWHNLFTIDHSKSIPGKFINEKLPISAEDLYQEFRNSGLNGQRVVMDVLGSQKEKHIKRGSILLTNPDKFHAILDSYNRQMKSVISDYKDPLDIYTSFNFDDLDSNKKMILYITGIDEHAASKLASNKEYVLDLFRWFINNRSIGFRQAKMPADKNASVIDGLLKGAAGYNRGLSFGPGLNFMRLKPIGGYGEYTSVTQNPLTYHPEKIVTFDDLIRQIGNLNLDPRELYRNDRIPLNEDHVRIADLAAQLDLPIYLNRRYLGALHDQKVPYGLYVNQDRVEVPGGNIIEASLNTSSSTLGIKDPGLVQVRYFDSSDDIVKYLLLLRDQRARTSAFRDFYNTFPMWNEYFSISTPSFKDFDSVYKRNKGLLSLASLDEFKTLIDKLHTMSIEEASGLTDREIALANKLVSLFKREDYINRPLNTEELAKGYIEKYVYPTEWYNSIKDNIKYKFGPSIPYSTIKSNVNKEK